jgi:hypothetical protein
MFKSKHVNVLMIFFRNKVIKYICIYIFNYFISIVLLLVVEVVLVLKKKDPDPTEIISDLHPEQRDPKCYGSFEYIDH